MAQLLSVNVGRPQVLATSRHGHEILSAIVKAPVAGRVAVRGVNLEGDDQADRTVHGGPDKAVYAYAAEDVRFWEAELGRELPAAAVGENLTTEGLDVTHAVIGERWAVGSTVLEVCQPRLPCAKLGMRFGDPRFVRTFGDALRPGAYLRIVQDGDVGAGDPVEVLERPGHGITVRLVADAILHEPGLRPRALEAPELADGLREWLA
jgi:MOSC domain-containing protein YiiM